MTAATTALTEDELGLVEECARRLRLVQADTATATPEERRELLHEEVIRALKGASSVDRQRLLKALLERFPVGGQIGGVVAAVPAPAEVPKPETPEELLGRFLTVAKELPAETREDWIRRLTEADLAVREQKRYSIEVPAEWLPYLGLKKGQQPDMERLVALEVTLTELILRVDQAAFKALLEMRAIHHDTQGELLSAFAQYLTGQTQSLDPQLHAFSGRLAALLDGIFKAGRNYGKEFLRLCSPMAIEETIKLEGGKLFGPSFKERCWDKYKDLANGFSTPELIDRQIRDCMAAAVKSKMSANR